MTILSIVIPAYNEEGGIAEIANRVLKIKPELAKVGIDELELLVGMTVHATILPSLRNAFPVSPLSATSKIEDTVPH